MCPCFPHKKHLNRSVDQVVLEVPSNPGFCDSVTTPKATGRAGPQPSVRFLPRSPAQGTAPAGRVTQRRPVLAGPAGGAAAPRLRWRRAAGAPRCGRREPRAAAGVAAAPRRAGGRRPSAVPRGTGVSCRLPLVSKRAPCSLAGERPGAA